MNITSKTNEKVKYWTNLKSKKFRDQEKKFIIEGDHLIKEAEKNGLVKCLISTNNKDADFLVTKDIMKKISDQKSISNDIAVLDMLEEKKVGNRVIVLDNLQDPGNLGTIIRSAVAFSFDTVVLSDTSVDLYNPKTIRATEGMIFSINVLRRNLNSFLPKLKKDGYKLIGTDVNAGTSIKKVKKEKLALVIGNEGSGISEEVRKMCDDFVNIRINKSCESLNASVAASILMYEVDNE